MAILESRQHPEQGVRACLGVLSLKKKYGPERLEAACGRALAIGAPSYHRVLSILEKKLENQALPDESSGRRLGEHENIRGAQYYSENQSEEIDHVTATYR